MFFTKNRLLAGIFLSYVILFVISMLTLRHHGINTPLAYLRFFIPLFPLMFFLVALGADAMENWLSFTRQNNGRENRTLLGNFMIASFVAALAITGPLRQIYVVPNNFTNHSAFQESCAALNWNRPYVSHESPVTCRLSSQDSSSFTANVHMIRTQSLSLNTPC